MRRASTRLGRDTSPVWSWTMPAGISEPSGITGPSDRLAELVGAVDPTLVAAFDHGLLDIVGEALHDPCLHVALVELIEIVTEITLHRLSRKSIPYPSGTFIFAMARMVV